MSSGLLFDEVAGSERRNIRTPDCRIAVQGIDVDVNEGVARDFIGSGVAIDVSCGDGSVGGSLFVWVCVGWMGSAGVFHTVTAKLVEKSC